MALNVYNSLSRSIEKFEPLNHPHVGLYTCGPTVYNYPHIGNYRAYIFGDMLKRYLMYTGYSVKHVMNITDVDDKTIRDSIAKAMPLNELTEFYTEGFYTDLNDLNILPANKYTKATDYIKEMLSLIEMLLEKGYAYKAEDNSIYFDIKKDAGYGKLSHFNLNELKENAKGRMAKDEYEKDNAQDFALWKAWDENDGEVFWNPEIILGRGSPIGKGRPGWHIECSAMATSELGESIDIHTGGVDLIFPHHENEIAQSECATGKPFAKYWMHNEWLLVEGKKMAKSAGNFYTLRDLIDKDISPMAYRYWLYTAHYRTKTNLSLETLRGAQSALIRLSEAFNNLSINQDNSGEDEYGVISESYKSRFLEYMDDDLNTPKALALMWDLVKDNSISPLDKRATMLDFDKVFGFGLHIRAISNEPLPEEIKSLIIERNYARENKDWEMSDILRAKIEVHGYEVKDTAEGTKLKKII